MSETATPAAAETPPAAEAAAPPAILGTEPAAPAAPATEAASPAAPAVPEKYEFTPPEVNGKPAEIDPAALTAFEERAREAGLTQEQFGKVAGYGAELIAQRIAEAAQAPVKAWNDMQAAWQAEIKADPEIGGDKLQPALAEAARALDAFGGQALREALVQTGAGNNPAIVRAFVQIGRAMGEAGALSTGRPAAAAKSTGAEQRARDVYNAAGGNYAPVGS